LQGRHESAMRRVGLKPETRKFHPHVTVARIARAGAVDVGRYIAANNLFAAPRFTVERFTLFSAKGGTGGGPYVAERHYPDEEFDDWDDGEG
ncbi:MAG: 2'-5' RNA ligase family protein, partial [Parvibaculum sp.]